MYVRVCTWAFASKEYSIVGVPLTEMQRMLSLVYTICSFVRVYVCAYMRDCVCEAHLQLSWTVYSACWLHVCVCTYVSVPP